MVYEIADAAYHLLNDRQCKFSGSNVARVGIDQYHHQRQGVAGVYKLEIQESEDDLKQLLRQQKNRHREGTDSTVVLAQNQAS